MISMIKVKTTKDLKIEIYDGMREAKVFLAQAQHIRILKINYLVKIVNSQLFI